MGDLRNKMRKLEQAEAERRARLRSAKAHSPSPPPTLRCDGCGMDGRDRESEGREIHPALCHPEREGLGSGKILLRVLPRAAHRNEPQWASRDPSWDVPAKIDGLPYKNWKRRTGFTETGTLAQMVERWLRLSWNHQQQCSLGWGPDGRRLAGFRRQPRTPARDLPRRCGACRAVPPRGRPRTYKDAVGLPDPDPRPECRARKKKSGYQTNIRQPRWKQWLPWMEAGHRCLVPVTSFSEYDWRTTPPTVTWFAVDESRPLFFFAGVWMPWNGHRGTKANPADGDHLLYSFLTTSPNDIVKPVHPKAMPVLLLDREARETWMEGSIEEALALQGPAPDDAVRIVASFGPKQDGA